MQSSVGANHCQIEEITFSARIWGIFVRAGRNRRVEHGKSVDKQRRICYQFTCVREDCRGTTWSIPDGWDGYGVVAKAHIFGPVGRSSKVRVIGCPEGRKSRNPPE
jgi:hypothetical protein